ncbi:hypothetical protein NC651_004584 [Populus alba x Populus x berolinensis]|nr:hypothetical protein NC651_004584 [Populus alba x Populus x berolinensis]
MPGKPDEIVLGSLPRLSEGHSIVSRDAIISSKIYANMRRWNDSAKMRHWIDVGARAHEFHAGGSLHHHSENIYQFLNEEMKREGYIPNIEVEKLKTWWPLSAIEQCIRRDCIFWLMTTAKMLNDKLT